MVIHRVSKTISMRHSGLITLFLCCSVLLKGQQIAQVDNIEISSVHLNQKRQLFIYTPVEYNEKTLLNYDVIYVFDSQNRDFFDLTHSLISFLNTDRQFIVVGITSPYYESTNYGRNNDMLPVPVNVDPGDFFKGHYGGNGKFAAFVREEVIPYIESNYRVTGHRICVGHSLSASFIINTIFTDAEMFDSYIALSPNFSYDGERMVTDIKNFDYSSLEHQKFVFLSNADEGITYWEEWKPAREKVYTFWRNQKNSDNKIHVVIGRYPDQSHWNSILPALTDGLNAYLVYSQGQH